MDFELSDEQRLLKETFARFCDERIKPIAQEIDEAEQYPRQLISELAIMGFLGLRYPESVGGSEMDCVSYCLAIEEIARGSMSLAACAAMQSLMGTHFVHKLGNEEIHERLLKPAINGEKLGTICITEPNAGSDLGSISTAAEKVDGGYELNGQKTWITAAPVADFFTVFARAGEEHKLTIFLVEKDFAGLEVGRSIEKMGVRASPTAEVSFSNCFVPDDHCLGEVGEGEAELRKLLDEIRIMTGARAIGVARAAVDDAVEYAAQRVQFGRPINRFQAVQMRLADMGTDLEAATHMVYYAAWLKATGRPHQREAAMAKLFATEKATDICEQASRVLASYGYAMEYPIQRYARDVRFTLYGGGTSDILKTIIARDMTK